MIDELPKWIRWSKSLGKYLISDWVKDRPTQ